MSEIATALSDASTKMNKAVEVAKEDFAAIRTGRTQDRKSTRLNSSH